MNESGVFVILRQGSLLVSLAFDNKQQVKGRFIIG